MIPDLDHYLRRSRDRRGIAAGDTLNCFQLESPAMRHLLRMLERARSKTRSPRWRWCGPAPPSPA
jgi:hypothetical protein